MRVFLLLILIVPATSFGIEGDKLRHFGVSLAAHTACSYLLGRAFQAKPEERWQTRLFCAFGVGMAGVFKERLDAISQNRNHLDGGDLLANGLGLGTSLLLTWQFEL